MIKQKIFNKNVPRVIIQVKSPSNIGKSRAITIYNMSIDDVADRIRFMFETLEKNEGDATTIKHYKYKTQKVSTISEINDTDGQEEFGGRR